jgi:hypothetical protein
MCCLDIRIQEFRELSLDFWNPWSLKVGATNSSKTPVPIYQMTWHHIPENFDFSKTLLQEPQISHKLKVWKKGLKNILKNLHPPIYMQL